jgi:serine phosphatase RsbU (regulator of sigma subunit)/anti-sigma regulatory factor (Ser/Thr protein kinase)
MDPTVAGGPGEARHGLLLAKRVLPFVVLAGSAVAIVVTSPTGHFALMLAVVPFLAAALHGVQATAAIGLLTVLTFASLRHWLADDGTDVWLIKLGLVAATAAVAVLVSQARVRDRELTQTRGTALTLQRGLLPHDFPDNSAAEIGYRYVPADTAAGVGGDWFDVIPLSGARVALVMGDVVGHGLRAAATMGRLRTAVHTLADLDLAPDEVLARMDDLVQRMEHDEAGHEPGASCLYMVYDPITRTCTMCSAGHTPPAFLAPDGRVDVQPPTQNPPLGFGGAPFEQTEVTLEEGTVIALYTDGLLDLRHRQADEAVDALAEVFGRGAGSAAEGLEPICDRVYDFLPAEAERDDDVALLLARTRTLGAGHVASWDFSARAAEVARARTELAGQLATWGLDEHVFTMELVVSELLTNAIRHAGEPVTLRLIKDAALICEVSDGSSTSPHARKAQPWEEGGRGLFLVGQVADRWGTRYTGGGKTIWAEKYLV